jgi:hypothetical protein
MNTYQIGWQEIKANARQKKYNWLIGGALGVGLLIAFIITGTLDYNALFNQ